MRKTSATISLPHKGSLTKSLSEVDNLVLGFIEAQQLVLMASQMFGKLHLQLLEKIESGQPVDITGYNVAVHTKMIAGGLHKWLVVEPLGHPTARAGVTYCLGKPNEN